MSGTEHCDPSGPSPLSGGLVREEQPIHPIPGTVGSSEQDENRPCAEEEASVKPVVSHAPDDSRDNEGEIHEVEQSAQPGCRSSGDIGPSPQHVPCPLPAQLSNPDCPEIAPITDDAQQASQALEQCYKQALQGLLATVKAQWCSNQLRNGRFSLLHGRRTCASTQILIHQRKSWKT